MIKTIELPRNINDPEVIKRYSITWNNNDEVEYILPEDLSSIEIEKYFSILMPLIPDNFVLSILSDLAEYPNTSHRLLDELFDKGNTACKVAICLRDDIPNNLIEKCLNSSMDDVIEHVVFNKLVSVEDCKKLLEKNNKESVRKAVERAIEQKS